MPKRSSLAVQAVLAAGLLVLSLLSAPTRAAEYTPAASEARLKRDVTFLAAPECEGRGVLTRGINRAADYIAAEFRNAGLKPGNGARYFQPFTLTTSVQQGPAKLVLHGPHGQKVELREGQHFYPLGMAEGGTVTGAPVVFAGYGASLTKHDYNDYDGLDVSGKVVVLIRGTPRPGDRGLANQYRLQASLTGKLTLAERKGAKAVLLVNDSAAARGEDELLDFDYTALSRSLSKIPAFHIQRQVLDAMLQGSKAVTLRDVERDIDRELKPHSMDLPGWSIDLESKVQREPLHLKNVVGVLPGAGPLANETVILGAHYDHLGYGGPSSLAKSRKRAIHPGADDNASGTAAVLELARRFAAIPNRQGRRLVFITFSGEEEGLFGSQHYCKKPLFPLESTAAMINLDMVGRLSPDNKTGKGKLLTQGHGTAKEFKGLLERLGKKYDFQLSSQPGGFGPSDHSSFCEKKVPVLFLWTGDHEDYHQPSDTADKIDVRGMRRIVDLTEEAASYLAGLEEKPAFVEVKGSGGARPSFGGPRLGIRPNYGGEDGGVEVMAVTEGLPAERAGIKVGDIIVSINGKPVRNMTGYMEALTTSKPGSTVDVTVLRKEKRIGLKVTLE